MKSPNESLPTFFPYVSYRDAAAAFAWLAEAFGFTTTADFRDSEGIVMHAEMSLGNGAIMLGTSTVDRSAEDLSTKPTEHGVYVYVSDVDAHYDRAKAAGAHIVFPPEDTEWGTRRYRALDSEGLRVELRQLPTHSQSLTSGQHAKRSDALTHRFPVFLPSRRGARRVLIAIWRRSYKRYGFLRRFPSWH